MPSLSYTPALAPMKVGERVIKSFYPALATVQIVYLFVHKSDKYGQPIIQKRKGREVWSEIKVISGLNAYLSSPHTLGSDDDPDDEGDAVEPSSFFVVLVSSKAWNDKLDDEQREALLDSTLCRAEYDSEKDSLTVRDFDVKEFHEIAKRRGAWHPELDKFFKVAKQMPLIPGARGKRRTAKKPAPAQRPRL